MQASIITIGDELLIGQVIDTNSAWMAQELNKAGIRVARRVAVGDVWDEIWQALEDESEKCDIVLITGGLGPTADDITKPLLCKYFNGKMTTDEGTLEHIKYIFEEVLKRPLLERNIKQAEVPDTCKVLANPNGTAPGMWFEKKFTHNGIEKTKIFVSMPGVPFEMKGIMTETVISLLKTTFQFPHIAHRTLLTAGVGESFLAESLIEFENNLPDNIKLAYLPNYGMVRLRLSATGQDKDLTEATLQDRFEQLQFLTHQHLVVAEDLAMHEIVAKLLIAKKKTVSTAESCTGGYIAHLLTKEAGASAYFSGSAICYSYEAKELMLNVSKELLEKKGAVSEEVVLLMAKGALKNINTDYTVAVSGIMGPTGGSDEKPVGTVWIAAGNKEKQISKCFHFRFGRERNIQLTAINALNMLRQFILDN